jgi:energy-coupling factor transport system substrate-specific component
MTRKLTIGEIVFISVMGAALGVIWWAYTFINDLIAPFLRVFALDGLLSGIWLVGGTFFAYIIRKPGSALLGEVIAAIIQGFISRWGLSSILYGVVQALPVELFFLALGYRRWNYITLAISGALSAFCGYALTFFWYQYFRFGTMFNLVQLVCNIISGSIIAGVLTKMLADRLRFAGVLNQFKIARDS